MGIGQMLPASSTCTYYLDCPATLGGAHPEERFRQRRQLPHHPPQGVHLTLAMTFPDLARPDAVLAGIRLLDEEFPVCSSGWARSTW